MKSARIILLFFIPILLSLVFSCCKSVEYNPDKFDFEHDDQYYFLKPTISLCSIAESENGYYFFSGANNSYLYYMDKKTMEPIILCNKPDCLHSDEPDGKKKQSCNAFFFDCHNLIYYDRNLYMIGIDIDSLDYTLYKVSLDGTNRKKVYTFQEGLQHLIIHRGYIYYDTNDLGTVGKNENNTTNACRVYRLNINRVRNGPELIFEEKGIYGGIQKIAGYKAYICFMFYKFTDSTLERMNTFIYRYTINDNILVMVKDNVGYFTFYNDRIIYSDINKNLSSCNMDGTDAGIISGITGSPVYADNYIYVDNMDLSDEKFIVYDWEGNIVKDFDNTIAKCTLYGGDDRYFFLEDEYSHNEFGNIHTIYMIDKSKLSASAEPIKVFEYVPKVQYAGMVAQEG
jgi:hypothetical protein